MTDEERKKRIHEITYSTDDRAELAERIVALEELVVQAYKCKLEGGFCDWCYKNEGCCPVERRMDEMGVPR